MISRAGNIFRIPYLLSLFSLASAAWVFYAFSSALFLATPAKRSRDVEVLDPQGMVFQLRDNDCGVAAFATLAGDLGKPVDLQLLERETLIPKAGLTLLSLRNMAVTHGTPLVGVFVDPANKVNWPTPWIAHLSEGEGHYVVVERHADFHWVIADPSRGRLRYSELAFRDRWSGYALVVDQQSR